MAIASKERTRSPKLRRDARRELLIEELVGYAQRVGLGKLEMLCDAAYVWDSLSTTDCRAIVPVLEHHAATSSRVPSAPRACPAGAFRMSVQGNRLALMEGGA